MMNIFNEIFGEFNKGTLNKNKFILPWVEKFRPENLKDILGHEHIVLSFKNFIKKKNFPNLILSGPSGTGKTSIIKSIINEMYKDNLNYILDINASEERGVDVVRKKISNFLSCKTYNYKEGDNLSKFIILDEADLMTYDAQITILGLMSKFDDAIFCFICNNKKKIINLIQSRTIIFNFSPLKNTMIKEYIDKISTKKISKEGIEIILKISKGDLRKCLNILQCLNYIFDNLDEKNVSLFTSYPMFKDIINIYDILINNNLKDSYIKINKIIKEKKFTLIDLLNELTEILINKYLNKEINELRFINILENLKEIQNKYFSSNEKIYLNGIIASFY